MSSAPDGRERILQAAIRSFADTGYAATSTAAVAKVAGVTQPLVHHHFGSKEGLWKAVVDHLFVKAADILSPQEAELAPVERLLRAVGRFVSHNANSPDLARILAREGASNSPQLQYIIDTYLRDLYQQALQDIRSAQAAGAIDAQLDPAFLFFFMLGAGGYLFQVPALAHSIFGIDPSQPQTQQKFLDLVQEIMRRAVFTQK